MNAQDKRESRISRRLCFALGFILPGASMFMWSYIGFRVPFWESLFAGIAVGLIAGILCGLFGERALNFVLQLF
jgi:hypothetical protein